MMKFVLRHHTFEVNGASEDGGDNWRVHAIDHGQNPAHSMSENLPRHTVKKIFKAYLQDFDRFVRKVTNIFN